MVTIKELLQLILCVLITIIYMPIWLVVFILQEVCKPLKTILKCFGNLANLIAEIS